jgi:hypothetical protein
MQASISVTHLNEFSIFNNNSFYYQPYLLGYYSEKFTFVVYEDTSPYKFIIRIYDITSASF